MAGARLLFHDQLTGGLGWRERPGTGAGAGQTMVCLHGIGSEARAFDAMAAALPPHLRVIAWEAPGYGPSVPLDAEWPLAGEYADALAGLADTIGLRQFHLLGHSLGTLVAAAFSVRHADRVRSLTLVSCAQGMGAAAGDALPAAAQARLDDLARLGAAEFAHRRAANLVHAPQANPVLVAAVAAGMARVRMPGYGQAVRMLACGNLSADAAKITRPTCVIVGAQDRVTPPAQSRAVWNALPDAVRLHFAELPDVGHAAPQQAPQALADTVARHVLNKTGALP
jgi:pimeloyl-ACP methyl ester carboxylesterase